MRIAWGKSLSRTAYPTFVVRFARVDRLERERKEASEQLGGRVVVPNGPCSVVRVSVHSPGSPGEEARDRDPMFDRIGSNEIEARQGCLRFGRHPRMARIERRNFCGRMSRSSLVERRNSSSIRTGSSMTSDAESNKSKIGGFSIRDRNEGKPVLSRSQFPVSAEPSSHALNPRPSLSATPATTPHC